MIELLNNLIVVAWAFGLFFLALGIIRGTTIVFDRIAKIVIILGLILLVLPHGLIYSFWWSMR
jgi:hypothetical protein